MLATLPSKEVLVGKLLGLMLGLPQRLVGALSGNLMQLMLTLTRSRAKKETIKGGWIHGCDKRGSNKLYREYDGP